MRLKLICTLVITLCFGALIALADSMELNNGSLIKGRFVGGIDTDQVSSRVVGALVNVRIQMARSQ